MLLLSLSPRHNTQAFMAELPTHLRQEMASLLNDGIIGDLFSEIFSECSPPFVAAILLRLELMVAVKGDILCCEGDVGEEMFFVLHGTLDVYKDDLKLGELEVWPCAACACVVHTGCLIVVSDVCFQ